MRVNEEAAALVKRAYKLYGTSNYSLEGVCDQLLKEGYVFKPQTPRMNKSCLAKMLTKPFYTGVYEYHGEKILGKHTPIIEQDLFDTVQKALKRQSRPQVSRKRKYAFTGLIKCGHCGCGITAQQHRKGRYIYYHCSNFYKECTVKKDFTREDRLIDMLGEVLKPIQVPKEVFPPDTGRPTEWAQRTT